MGKYLFILAALILFVGILRSHGINRLVWFFCGSFFFQDRIILVETPTVVSFHRFLIYTLAFSVLISKKNLLSELKEFPLAKAVAILFVGMLCIALFDGRHTALLSVYRIVDDFMQSFMLVVICYLCYDNTESDIEDIIKPLLTAFIILSIYGIYNFVTSSNPYDNYITQLYKVFSPFDVYAQSGDRFRVNSFTAHPIFFGYLSAIMCAVSIFALITLPNLKVISLFSLPLSFLSLILSNSRTPLLAFAVGVSCFVLFALEARFKIAICITILFAGIILYNVNFFQQRIDGAVQIFSTSGSTTSGSSLEMRTTQLRASYNEFLKSPIAGNGLYYINENLGWGQDIENLNRDEDFQGFESHIFHLLIEQGAIGIVGNLIFFFSAFFYFVSKLSSAREKAALGFSVLIMFLIFICGTGTVDSWIISMGLLGVLIKDIEQS